MKFIKFTVLLMSILTIMGTTAITPILGLLSAEFSDVSMTMIKMLVTMPAIFIMVICLLTGWLSTKISKKKLILIGIVLYMIGGLGGGMAKSYGSLLGFRVVLGFGIGLIMPLVASVITDLFDGEERSKMLGLSAAVCTFGGVIATVASGMLSTISWRHSFLVYGVAVLVFIVTFFGLPESSDRESVKADATGEKKKVQLPRAIYGYAILGVLFTMTGVFISTGLAMFIQEEGLGSSSKAGFAIAVFFFASIITGGMFSKLNKVLRQYSILFVTLCYFLSFWMFGNSHSMTQVFMGSVLAGLGFGFSNPYLLFHAGLAVNKFANVVAISVISSSFYVGQFLSPLVFSLIGRISGDRAVRYGFKTTAMVFAVGIVINILLIGRNSRVEKKEPEPEN